MENETYMKRLKDRLQIEFKKQDRSGVYGYTQRSVAYIRMLQDGICQVTKTFFSKTIQFYDINYQLALNEERNGREK